MILKTKNLRRFEITFFNSILSARLISVLDFILRSGIGRSDFNRGQIELPTPTKGLTLVSQEPPRRSTSISGRRPSDTSHRRVKAVSIMFGEVTAGPWQSEKMNRRRGVLIRLIMFERAARRGFARTSIPSYQTTVLIESLFLYR